MKIVTVVGARPQFIKAGSVSRAIAEHNAGAASDADRILERIVHTGQHFDQNMSAVFFWDLEIPAPDFNLGVNSLSHGAMTGQMIEKLECILLEEVPDWVLVYGDTNSTLAGALAAAKLHIPVAHVEAGLRSFNRRMPEEINRVLADHLSALLLCPTQAAVENLAREGITEGVRRVGDVMFDAFRFYQAAACTRVDVLERLSLQPRAYCLATVHREENTDDPVKLQSILSGLGAIGAAGKPVVLPMHPRTRKRIAARGLDQAPGGGVRFIDPVGYLEMIALESNAFAILTDSGGVQKEACFSGVPCITLRDETEWVETVAAGWNVLAGTASEKIVEAFRSIAAFSKEPVAALYGDGRAAHRVLGELLKYSREALQRV